jgi:hypothetical protein
MCILVLDPDDDKALNLSGSASIIDPDCTVAVNSDSPTALNVSGSACVEAKTISIVGGYGGACYTPEPETGSAPEDDPFAGLDAPTYGGCDHINYTVSSSSPIAMRTLNPGVYCNGITINSTPGIHFNPGTYIILGGGFESTGGVTTLSGTDVTFYITGNATYKYDAVIVSGGGALNLSAPTSGPMEAMLFFQNRNIISTKVNTISGGSTMNIEGSLYFPTTKVVYSGGSTAHGAYTMIVSRLLELTGPSGIGTDYSGLAHGSPVKTRVGLAE